MASLRNHCGLEPIASSSGYRKIEPFEKQADVRFVQVRIFQRGADDRFLGVVEDRSEAVAFCAWRRRRPPQRLRLSGSAGIG
jgi:hypothetical protein